MRHAFACLLLLTASACTGNRYVYAPEKDHRETVVSAANGTFRVSSLGVVDVKSGNGPWIRSLHLRALAENDSRQAPWSLLPTLLLHGDKRLTARFVNGEDAPQSLAVAPGERRAFELYFPLPEGTRTADDIEQFTMEWQVSAGDEPIRGSVAFERVAPPEALRVYADPYFPGPYYWGGYVVPVRPVVPMRRYYSK